VDSEKPPQAVDEVSKQLKVYAEAWGIDSRYIEHSQ